MQVSEKGGDVAVGQEGPPIRTQVDAGRAAGKTASPLLPLPLLGNEPAPNPEVSVGAGSPLATARLARPCSAASEAVTGKTQRLAGVG